MLAVFSRQPRLPATMARVAAIGGLGLGMVAMPASAHAGFFEQLFGLQPPAVEQPTTAQPEYLAPPRVHRPARKRVAVETIGSGKQTPTDLMHDKTLRQGDAVMMKDGMHVYAGSSRASHQADDFVPLDQAELPRKQLATLAAVDTTRASVAEKDAGAAGTLASGRSAAVSAPIVQGTVVSDARGGKVRYVGP